MECNLVWNHTSDFKIGRVQVQFEITSYNAWFQTNIVWHEVQLQLITAILKSQNSVSTNTIKFWPSSQFLEKRKEKGF